MFRLRFSVRALALLALCLCLPVHSRAGRVEDRDGKTIIHVVVFGLPDPSNTDTANRAGVEAVRAFREGFPRLFAEKYRARYEAAPEHYGRHNWANVEIELKQFTGLQVEGVEVDMLAIAGGVPPDVLYINFRKSDTYIRGGFLYPLDKPEDGYLTGMTQEEIDFRVHPMIWQVIRRRGPGGDKHVWALPWGGALGKVLLFRKSLFDEKGIPYPTNDWTWDQMMDAARRLTDPKRGLYGMLLSRGKHESWWFITWLWSAGADVLEYNEERDEWRCVFDTREAAVALDYYTRLSAERWTDADGKVRRGYSSKDAADSWAKWERGEIGMMMAYIDEKLFATINPDLVGMVPVPLGPTGLRGGELNSRMMGLFAGIRDPAVRDAAWEYMRFTDSEAAMAIHTRVLVEGGLGRFVNPRYLRQFGYHEIERLSPKGWAETFEIAISTGKPEPCGKNSNVAYDLLTYPIQEAEQLALKDQLPADPEARLDLLQEILRKANARANAEMLGLVSPAERARRRVVAALVLATIVGAFAFVFWRIFRIFTPPPLAHAPRGGGWNLRRYGWAYLLLVPAVLTIFTWQYTPLARGSMLAFQDVKLLGGSTWVGLDNFGDVIADGFWWRAVFNSLRYSFLVLSLTFLPPIVLAVFLQEIPRGRLLLRITYYLPAVITGVVTMLLWKQFYEPSERGALNAVVLRIPALGFLLLGALLLAVALLFARRLLYHGMRRSALAVGAAGTLLLYTCLRLAQPILFPAAEPLGAGLEHLFARLLHTTPEPYQWLSNPDTAMLACVLPMVWAGMGPGCLIYLAALKSIPEDYYEAADMDGATFIDKILFVVVPFLRPLILINFVGAFIGAWYGGEGNILVMTGGGANTEVAGLRIWYKAFTFLQFGPATAMAWMLAVMLIGFTVYQLRILSRLEFRTVKTRE
jgi:multiple sugar transport system permease protein